ncbi:MAG TPA: FAD-binding oxidoreductase [Solirubrobacteraceae bacterium]|nr:FAD-binding oxidoreductase [Solirubrobacteraceae bacterium]
MADQVWWGWGREDAHAPLPEPVAAALSAELGALREPRGPVALEEVALPGSRLDAGVADRLGRSARVRTDRAARVGHAAGRSYPDLVRLRRGDGSPAPDAVVVPGRAQDVGVVLEACAAAGVAVVPFGGGTSVVGGVEPLAGPFGAVVALDLRGLGGEPRIDERSLTAVLGAGLSLPQAEERLAAWGLTLGHFPQSFEFATVGGCVATRSAGQASTGYGRIDELVRGLTLVAPAARVELGPRPRSAAGPELRELLVGSEGAFGVITAAALSVRPRPEVRRYEGWAFRSFAEGAEALRVLEQSGAAPDVARLSDEEETRATLMQASGHAAQLLGRYLGLRGRACLAILGWEGERADVSRERARTAALARRWGGAPLGAAPGRAWERARYHGPYLRDALLDRGLLVETLETATQWSSLGALHRSVRAALRAALGDASLVLCHLSHLYASGASLYFTWLAQVPEGAELERWREAKAAASQAIVAEGATITHHHAVGRDHVPYLEAEIGPAGMALLRAAKAELDPAGIMNPGKLLPA